VNDAVHQHSNADDTDSDITLWQNSRSMQISDVEMAKLFVQIFNRSKILIEQFLMISRLINHYFSQPC